MGCSGVFRAVSTDVLGAEPSWGIAWSGSISLLWSPDGEQGSVPVCRLSGLIAAPPGPPCTPLTPSLTTASLDTSEGLSLPSFLSHSLTPSFFSAFPGCLCHPPPSGDKDLSPALLRKGRPVSQTQRQRCSIPCTLSPGSSALPEAPRSACLPVTGRILCHVGPGVLCTFMSEL